MTDPLAGARSFLFVPGHRPDRFAKAAASGCDLVVLDLEDAVGPDRKADAREHVRSWLDDGQRAVVRINAPGTPWSGDDLSAVAGRAAAVMVPKAEDRAVLDAIARRSGAALIPLIETALGVASAVEVCRADAVVRPAFGSIDLAAQLGVDPASHAALQHARSAVVLAAAAAGCGAPVDGVTTVLDADTVLRDDLAHAAELGFTGKLCIHPRQVPLVNDAFTPSAAEVRWAEEVLASATDGSVGVHDGRMVDRPVILRARAILARGTAR
ncbi:MULTISPECIES: HpcH/HpaI aldolase/citrate lyase family protein [Amycolatopsis]|uniref:CoA ester lyase n=1 Tax=Amycolatopsis thermalba TaxID=944492 RepID=A0ABY4NYF9_9PSEU|nr:MULTISPECIES: CoA ester lyase [Amycolatopsis]OXM75287.1 CoA ester lyase [Amycolatopsis sp. KNN50.9b]UQS25110.1 CoA ester lyase [Amycolatopsis thermalba]